MRMKSICRLICALCVALVFVSTGTVAATWKYAQGEVTTKTQTFKLNIFPWTGSEVLPEDDLEGQNHRTLIERIVNGAGIGLNTSNSYLNQEIDDRRSGSLFVPKRDTLGSMAVTQGSELNELFNLETDGIEFLIHMVSNTEYHLYTTSVYLGERGEINSLTGKNKTPGSPTTPIGEYISPIYRTVLQYADGVWTAVETKTGKAKSAWYEESRSDRNMNGTQIPSFDPDSWVEEE